MMDNQTAQPLAKEIVTLLRRPVDADGKLLRYQINPETDAETIVRAEAAATSIGISSQQPGET